MTERLLLSFADLKIILNRNIDAFCVMSDVANLDQKVKLTDAQSQPERFSGTRTSTEERTSHLSHQTRGMQKFHRSCRKSFLEKRQYL